MDENARKNLLVGIAGGLVAWWSVHRLYTHSRSEPSGSAAPYWAGAAIGAAYGALVLGRNPALLARVPLVAALQVGAAESRENPPIEGQSVMARIAAKGLQQVTQRALFK